MRVFQGISSLVSRSIWDLELLIRPCPSTVLQLRRLPRGLDFQLDIHVTTTNQQASPRILERGKD